MILSLALEFADVVRKEAAMSGVILIAILFLIRLVLPFVLLLWIGSILERRTAPSG